MVLIRLKSIIDEVFQDYNKPSMMLATCNCDWKCARDGCFDKSICQNSSLNQQKNIDVSIEDIVDRYIKNPITNAIVIAGLEPFLQFNEVLSFIKHFRKYSTDDIVIYTGYYPFEIQHELLRLKEHENIIIKFGRYIPNKPSRYDEVLGVELASHNQYATKIS